MKLLRRGFLFLLFLFLISSLTRNLFEYKKNYSFYENYKKEYEEARQKKTRLKTEILKKNDPNEIEKIIRNKLNLLRPNEIAIILPQPTPTPLIFTPTPLPVYQQWLETFFKD